MYNSRTKSTLLPRSAARKTNKFPSSLSMVAVSKNRSSFIYMCLRSVHSLLSFRFGGCCSCLTTHPPFTPLRSVHFTHLSTAQHRWLSRSISFPNPFSITRLIHPCPFPTHFQWSIFHTAASPPH